MVSTAYDDAPIDPAAEGSGEGGDTRRAEKDVGPIRRVGIGLPPGKPDHEGRAHDGAHQHEREAGPESRSFEKPDGAIFRDASKTALLYGVQ